MRASVSRISASGEEIRVPAESDLSADQEKKIVGLPAPEMWMLLLVRMITRGPDRVPDWTKAEETEANGDLGSHGLDVKGKGRALDPVNARQTLCDYVVADFSARCVPFFQICGVSCG